MRDALLDPAGTLAELAIDVKPAGWTWKAWMHECVRMALACETVRPDLSEQWRRRAAAARRIGIMEQAGSWADNELKRVPGHGAEPTPSR